MGISADFVGITEWHWTLTLRTRSWRFGPSNKGQSGEQPMRGKARRAFHSANPGGFELAPSHQAGCSQHRSARTPSDLSNSHFLRHFIPVRWSKQVEFSFPFVRQHAGREAKAAGHTHEVPRAARLGGEMIRFSPRDNPSS